MWELVSEVKYSKRVYRKMIRNVEFFKIEVFTTGTGRTMIGFGALEGSRIQGKQHNAQVNDRIED